MAQVGFSQRYKRALREIIEAARDVVAEVGHIDEVDTDPNAGLDDDEEDLFFNVTQEEDDAGWLEAVAETLEAGPSAWRLVGLDALAEAIRANAARQATVRAQRVEAWRERIRRRDDREDYARYRSADEEMINVRGLFADL
jgi:hypothetical protein